MRDGPDGNEDLAWAQGGSATGCGYEWAALLDLAVESVWEERPNKGRCGIAGEDMGEERR